MPARRLAEHGPEPDQDLVRAVAVALRVHRATARVHVLGEQEVVADAGAVLGAQLGVVARRQLASEAESPGPRERDARVTVLRRVRGAERGARQLALRPV